MSAPSAATDLHPQAVPAPAAPDAPTTASPPVKQSGPAAGLPQQRVGPPPAGDESEWNPLGLDYRMRLPRPPIRGRVVDWHSHLLALRHADVWFEAADHYGIDDFVTMAPLEEAIGLQRHWGHRLHFIAVPQWGDSSGFAVDNWRRRNEAFFNLGSRIVKFHAAPGTMAMRGYRLDDERLAPLFQDAVDRGMILMSHIGDPDTWYNGKYTDHAKFGTRQEHFKMWESLLQRYPHSFWVGAHLGGNPEDLGRLQYMLDTYPQLYLDLSATRWMVRELSIRRDDAREFVIRNKSRLLWGSDQVSGDDRGFGFLASRFWAHRKLFETAYAGPVNIFDPDLPKDRQPWLRGLALPDDVLQRIYRDNAVDLLAKVGLSF